MIDPERTSAHNDSGDLLNAEGAISWDIVINGAWNVAILTPDGIRKRLFKLPNGTPIEVEVAIDRPGSFRVAHEDIVVEPASNQLRISSRSNDLKVLTRGKDLCRTALEALPETPFFAGGINIRYGFAVLPDVLLDVVRAPLDDRLSDSGYQVKGISTTRTVVVPPGELNVLIVQERPSLSGSLQLNFHSSATVVEDLVRWIERVDEFVEMSSKVLNILKVSV